MRDVANPGNSLISTGSLPSLLATATVFATASSEVSSPRTTSTSAIRGTGLKKCMPTTRIVSLVAVMWDSAADDTHPAVTASRREVGSSAIAR